MSEIMLQQTQVEAVRPYFERFLARFPDLQALAAAPEADVLQHWAGLGYYSRARNLHRAAQIVAASAAGELPRTVEALMALPGIGRYTAGAIASIGWNVPAPILDGNVMRVLCRILALRGDPREGQTNITLWDAAAELVEGPQPGVLNEALMELGALVCVPGMPRCGDCPVRKWCRAYLQGIQNELPERRPSPPAEERSHVALVVRHGDTVLMEQRRGGSIWRGLWTFPTDFPEDPSLPPDEAVQHLARSLGIEESGVALLGWIRHGVMQWRITLRVFETQLETAPETDPEGSTMRLKLPEFARMVPLAELESTPMPAPHRRISRLLKRQPEELDLFGDAR